MSNHRTAEAARIAERARKSWIEAKFAERVRDRLDLFDGDRDAAARDVYNDLASAEGQAELEAEFSSEYPQAALALSRGAEQAAKVAPAVQREWDRWGVPSDLIEPEDARDPFAESVVRAAQAGDRESAVRSARYFAARKDPATFAAKATDAELWDAALHAGDPEPGAPGADLDADALAKSIWGEEGADSSATNPSPGVLVSYPQGS